MALVRFDAVQFQYPSSPKPLFNGLNIAIETQWRTGFIARNGRGKSTLLGLIHGALRPNRGRVVVPVETALFPFAPRDPESPTEEIIKEAIAPFALWQISMTYLLEAGNERSLAEYAVLFDRYQRAGGFAIDSAIRQECQSIGLREELLGQPFSTLSGGEQTRALVLALFLRKDAFPLLDEPTNHLDMQGRETLARYLSAKKGFIIVSHDQHFLDLCVDHVLSINRGGIRIHQGNFSRWREQMKLEEESELARDANLRQQIRSLEEAAERRRTWANAKEKQKTSAYDSGYVGHRAAKLMKGAVRIERRAEEQLEEKKSLLQNREVSSALTLRTGPGTPPLVASLDRVQVEIGGKVIFSEISATFKRGDRIVLRGRNGSGKTTLLRVMRGEITPTKGSVHIPGFVKVVSSYQTPLWNEGFLRHHIDAAGLDETLFRTVLGALDVRGDIFDRPLETFSVGERKKVDLCRSFVIPAHLYLWDEPLNYVDIFVREQLEEVILACEPTMVLVEHDRKFVETVATGVIEMK